MLATLSRWRSWVQIPSGTLDGTVRKPAKRPSSNLGDRLWVRFPPVLQRPSGGTGRHTTLRTSRLHGMGVRLSPWSLRSGLEPGFQHGLIRRPTPVQIRPPQLGGRVRKSVKRPGREPGESLWVRFPPRLLMGCWSNRTTPALHTGNEGATPSRSTYGRQPDTVGRAALLRRFSHGDKGSTPLPSARRPDGETDDHASLRTRRSGFESWSGCFSLVPSFSG